MVVDTSTRNDSFRWRLRAATASIKLINLFVQDMTIFLLNCSF